VTRLLLVAHGLNASLRQAVFGGTAGLDPAGLRAAEQLVAGGNEFVTADEVLAGPAPACAQTASPFGAAAGLTVRTEPALADCDYGAWTGRRFDEVAAADPEGVHRWLSEPDAAPHGGESLTALLSRVGDWLAGFADRRTVVVAVTHATVIRAAVVRVLGAPPESFWRIDVAPAAVLRLRSSVRTWSLLAE